MMVPDSMSRACERGMGANAQDAVFDLEHRTVRAPADKLSLADALDRAARNIYDPTTIETTH